MLKSDDKNKQLISLRFLGDLFKCTTEMKQ